MNKLRKYIPISIILAAFILYALYIFHIPTESLESPKEKPKIKVIFTSGKTDNFGVGPDLTNCPVKNCEFGYYDGKEIGPYDCLVIHLRRGDPRKFLSLNACTIAYNFESDIHCNICHDPSINCTFEWTHKENSDFEMYTDIARILLKKMSHLIPRKISMAIKSQQLLP